MELTHDQAVKEFIANSPFKTYLIEEELLPLETKQLKFLEELTALGADVLGLQDYGFTKFFELAKTYPAAYDFLRTCDTYLYAKEVLIAYANLLEEGYSEPLVNWASQDNLYAEQLANKVYNVYPMFNLSLTKVKRDTVSPKLYQN